MVENLYNQHQKTIESLVNEGYVILQVFSRDNTCFYFAVFDFKESFSNPTAGVEFNAVRGVNITDFLKNQSGNPNAIQLISKFQQFMETANVVRCEFSNKMDWLKWGSAAR